MLRDTVGQAFNQNLGLNKGTKALVKESARCLLHASIKGRWQREDLLTERECPSQASSQLGSQNKERHLGYRARCRVPREQPNPARIEVRTVEGQGGGGEGETSTESSPG